MRRLVALVLGGLALAGATAAMADDPEAGRKVASMCRTCHGLDGFAQIPIAPHIGGEPKSYLESQLMAFKTGAREHEMMSLVAAGLSAQQISDVSAWYASHSAAARLPEGVDPAQAPDACVSCHGADGMALFPDAPNLAGETNIYIDTQLKAFRLGKRTHEIMSGIAAEMTDDEIRNVADWYGAVNLTIEMAQSLPAPVAGPRTRDLVKRMTMPAKSKSQQKAAGAALAAKRGEINVSELKGAAREMYDSMSENQLEDFAASSHDGLPDKTG